MCDCAEAYLQAKAFVLRDHHVRMVFAIKVGDIIDVGTNRYKVTKVNAEISGRREIEFDVVGKSNQHGTGVMSEEGLFSCTITDSIDHVKNWKLEGHHLAKYVTLTGPTQETVLGLLF